MTLSTFLLPKFGLFQQRMPSTCNPRALASHYSLTTALISHIQSSVNESSHSYGNYSLHLSFPITLCIIVLHYHYDPPILTFHSLHHCPAFSSLPHNNSPPNHPLSPNISRTKIMAESILYGLVQEVLKNLVSAPITEIASAWGFKSQLKKLKNTTNTLKNVLLDAEERQADSAAVRDWLERLSTVVYAADDLFDEFTTVAAQKELTGGHKLTKEVCTFFSHSNQVALAFKISRKIKKIREELDDIEKDGKKFEFVHRSPERGSAMSRGRDQTISYVDEDKVVGREDDKKSIVKMLLESSSTGHDEGLPVIPIVGMGGMGKTALAQLIYNDPQVQEYFEMRLWVCVSDVFDIKAIIEKLLKSATNNETANVEMDQLQGKWRKEVEDKKYLLVLDDIWNEKREEWVKLMDLLNFGRRGSKILVTTRSREVAKITSVTHPYDLKALTKEQSEILFEKMAFKPGEAEEKPDLVEIGKEIVKKCGCVPLAIRTLGCFLYGKQKGTWLSVKDSSLEKIPDSQGDIMNILRFSYHHLWSPLKNCFAYCALFPKDYEFDKEMLIDLWIAEGFIVPVVEGQSLDDVAEEYFHTLLHRSFFQDIQRNRWEEIESCKMHDLMHDLAQEVAGVKCKVAKSDERNFDEKSIHVSLACQSTPSWKIPNSMLNMKLLRTFLLPEKIASGSPSTKSISLLARFRSLRVLDLSTFALKSLPRSIGKLIHLRYLNLSLTLIEKLPDSITDLWNLQTLRLDWCSELKTLPANMRKLTNLRCLDVVFCDKLSHMPSGLGGLTSLNRLPVFIVGTAADERYKSTAKLSDLKNLNNLRGVLEIDIRCKSSDITMLEAREAELSNKHGLTELEISLPDHDECDCKHDEAVLEALEPPSELKRLIINDYRGENLPSWARTDNFCKTLPNLVQITLRRWKRCQQLPAFSQLPFLKRLSLGYMERVEYIESDDACGVPSSTSSSRPAIFFPSLEELHLVEMENLKGWWKEVEAIENENGTSKRASNELAAQQMPRRLSKLSHLYILNCPKLRMLPLCPNLEDLTLRGTNEILSVVSSAPFSSPGFKLKRLYIEEDDKLESTEGLVGVFTALSSSLQSLTFYECKKLRSIAKGLEHLTNLEDLGIYGCEELDDVGGDEEEGMPWKALNTSLRSLTLSRLPQLVGLPTGLQHLSNLRYLTLRGNDGLEELPEWMSCLSSLESLELDRCPKLTSLPEAFRQLTTLNHLKIIDCPGLKARCQEGPNGSEWPKIQHIPHRRIS